MKKCLIFAYTKIVKPTIMKQLVNFHIGRGGRFNNPGYLTFVSVGVETKDLIEQDFFINEEETNLLDYDGNIIGDYEGGDHVYNYDIDGDYDTSYGVMVEEWDDLSEFEKIAVLDAQNNWEFESAFDVDLKELQF